MYPPALYALSISSFTKKYLEEGHNKVSQAQVDHEQVHGRMVLSSAQ